MASYIVKLIPGKGKVWHRPFVKTWGITIRAFVIVAIILIIKFFIEKNNLDFIPMGGLITAFISGVFFTISILFAGAITDYKESEKIPGEMAVSIKSLYKDGNIISVKDKKIMNDFQRHVTNLLFVINDNFRKNHWKLKEIDFEIDKINNDVKKLADEGVPPGYITKMRSELSTIDRLSHRVDVITETTFIPAAYTLAQVAIFTLVFILLFVKTDTLASGLIIIGAISSVLISLVFLIKDMDSPFAVNIESYADADLSILFNLEEYMKTIAPKKEAAK